MEKSKIWSWNRNLNISSFLYARKKSKDNPDFPRLKSLFFLSKRGQELWKMILVFALHFFPATPFKLIKYMESVATFVSHFQATTKQNDPRCYSVQLETFSPNLKNKTLLWLRPKLNNKNSSSLEYKEQVSLYLTFWLNHTQNLSTIIGVSVVTVFYEDQNWVGGC